MGTQHASNSIDIREYVLVARCTFLVCIPIRYLTYFSDDEWPTISIAVWKCDLAKHVHCGCHNTNICTHRSYYHIKDFQFLDLNKILREMHE